MIKRTRLFYYNLVHDAIDHETLPVVNTLLYLLWCIVMNVRESFERNRNHLKKDSKESFVININAYQFLNERHRRERY